MEKGRQIELVGSAIKQLEDTLFVRTQEERFLQGQALVNKGAYQGLAMVQQQLKIDKLKLEFYVQLLEDMRQNKYEYEKAGTNS